MLYELFTLNQEEAPSLAHYLSLQGAHYQGLLFWHPKHFLVIDQTILIQPREKGSFWYANQAYRIDYDGVKMLRLAIQIKE